MPKTYDVTLLLLTQIWAKLWSAKYACTAKDWLSAHLSENSIHIEHLEGQRPVIWKSNNYLILNERWKALKVYFKLRQEASAHLLPEIVIKKPISTFGRLDQLLTRFR